MYVYVVFFSSGPVWGAVLINIFIAVCFCFSSGPVLGGCLDLYLHCCMFFVSAVAVFGRTGLFNLEFSGHGFLFSSLKVHPMFLFFHFSGAAPDTTGKTTGL